MLFNAAPYTHYTHKRKKDGAVRPAHWTSSVPPLAEGAERKLGLDVLTERGVPSLIPSP